MAEWFVGPVMEKIIDTCFEYFKDQVRWQTGMKEELQKLRDIHPQIQAVVSAYSQAQIEDPALNKWLWQLRDAVDEADDVLDVLKHRKHENQASNNNTTERVIEVGQRAVKKDPYLNKLEEAVQKLEKISAKVSNLHHLLENRRRQEQQQQQLEMRETGSMPANDLLGRSDEMEFVRQWLRNPCHTEISNPDFYRNVSLLSVVGHGGMGKTTLLQHVYENGTAEEFDVKMWVCVSNNFNAKTVIKNILESLKEENINLGSLEALQRSLKSEVTSKRFLLVLDDIWEVDEAKWKNVLSPLRHGSLGSKILITTRLDYVASMFAKMIKKSKETLTLKGLEEETVLQVFNTHAFAGIENPDDEFRSIARKMVKKFSGCPLAAKVIGGILNDYMDERYWEKVLNTNIGNVASSQNHLLPILKLSYIYLPKFLQNCFAFCCVFPQDHEFDKNDLIRMWIALGFIESSNIEGETIEDIGTRYFDILVRKSFFDEFRTYEDKIFYKMHDLLHELAQSVSMQECFRVVNDKELSIPKTIRHLSINTHSSRRLEAAFKKMGKFKNLRSLFLSFSDFDELDGNVISEILKASESIRLLVIYPPPYNYNMLEPIGCLIHLRYLKVEGQWGFKLPRSISHLYHLQFLISKRLQMLEMDKIGWKELKTNENCQLITDVLVIKDPYLLLRSSGSLRILTIEENDDLVSFPGEIEQWFLQQHTSSLCELRFDKLQSLQSLPSSLERLTSLETLHVWNVPQLKLLPNPPASLQTLRLYNLKSLQCLPSLPAISFLHTLELKNIPLLKSLPDLPSSLVDLVLRELESLQCLPSRLPAPLNRLWIIKVPRLLQLPELPSSLENLEVRELESLQCLPSSLPTLRILRIIKVPRLLELPDLPSSLKYLFIDDCHLQLMERHESFDIRMERI